MFGRGGPIIRAVVFDLSGVVCQMRHGRRLAALAALSDATAAEIDAEIWRSGLDNEFDRGRYSSQEIYTLFQRRFGFRGDYQAFARAWVEGFAPDRELLAVIDRIRPGTVLAILSDNGPVLREAMAALLPEVARRFHHVLFSCEIGALKPAPEVFAEAERRLGLAAEQICFFDDLEPNVAAALRAGWQGVVYTNAADAAAALKRAGLLTAPR